MRAEHQYQSQFRMTDSASRRWTERDCRPPCVTGCTYHCLGQARCEEDQINRAMLVVPTDKAPRPFCPVTLGTAPQAKLPTRQHGRRRLSRPDGAARRANGLQTLRCPLGISPSSYRLNQSDVDLIRTLEHVLRARTQKQTDGRPVHFINRHNRTTTFFSTRHTELTLYAAITRTPKAPTTKGKAAEEEFVVFVTTSPGCSHSQMPSLRHDYATMTDLPTIARTTDLA
ncbi:hypothetical protein BaRGS_00028878 [Batillaria attramentaria]|uniref:Uncharacterized protein n=1 Tax=Batillaria attramentaria TaxID=370345 RepID=A0ABD0JY98_9CAEN